MGESFTDFFNDMFYQISEDILTYKIDVVIIDLNEQVCIQI